MAMGGSNKFNVAIVTFPLKKSGFTPLENLADIVDLISENFCIVSGIILGDRKEAYTDRRELTNILEKRKRLSRSHINSKNICVYIIEHKPRSTKLTRIISYLYTQLKITLAVVKNLKKIDLWIFFIGGEGLLLPILIVKIFKKKPILAFAGSGRQVADAKNDSLVKFLSFLSKINCTLANRIILYSPNLIKEWNFEKYRNKILIAHEHFLDFDKFEIKKKLSERNNSVGYIGRLSEEKGVLNFVRAIPEILKERNDMEFLIGGDGQLRGEIEKYISGKNLNDKVKLAGWIPHEKLPDYLNELKLVVLPSFTEGLPNIMLEAMACGTPVLATPVGAIPDVITDGETGFIMENNSPECIARNVMRALKHPNLERIAENARALVEREFTYEKAVERWRGILKTI